MNCLNCKKQIPDDSEFCIFCGSEIEADIIIDEIKQIREKNKISKNNNEVEIIGELEKEMNFSNYLLDEKKKFKILLAVFIPILSIAIIILSIYLALYIKWNNSFIDQLNVFKNQNNSLNVENKVLSDEKESLESELNLAINSYNKLQKDYDYLKQSSISKTTNTSYSNSTNKDNDYTNKNTTSENL
jgi:RNA polymerase subunit RPABC4/transcription elongation factor Spt4